MDWALSTLSSSRQPPGQSGLLDLPAELRTYIFELSLTSSKPLVTFHLDPWQRDTLQEATQPALTRTNRQLRAESLLLFYTCNAFVLHTEGEKAAQGFRWARCCERYLGELTAVTIWQRFVALTNSRSESNGALAVSLRRGKGGEAWAVGERWEWVTVTRKPAGVSIDAGFIMGSLRRLVMENPRLMDTAEDLFATVTDLRSLYVKEKMS